MNDIKFSFEGDPAVLMQMLRGLSPAISPGVGAAPPPSIVPRHVSEQQVPSQPAPGSEAHEAQRVKQWAAQAAPSEVRASGEVLSAPTMEPLHTDPVYDQTDGSSNPAPTHYPTGSGHEEPLASVDLAQVRLDPEAGKVFTTFLNAWLVGFECEVGEDDTPVVEQPDRLTLLKDIGSGQWPLPILRWLSEFGSLQGGIAHLLGLDDLDRVDRISANIAQVAHAAFPDLVGLHDYSTRWKRKLQESAS